ncbi:MAG: carbohydrate ABC transporter permease [Synergistaceae bacterium]|nr:carbohydrate ABC transporter permease [Synergistaceae bacterium]
MKLFGKSAKIFTGIILVLVSVFPSYWLLAMSVRPMDEMRGRISLIPSSLTLEHFRNLFTEKDFSRALANSLQVSLISLAFSLVFGVCAAYVLTRQRFRFRAKKPFNFWILIVRILPPVAFTIPLYTMFNRLGLLSTKIPALLSCILINIPFIVWFMVSFFQRLPEDIEKSARIDGASEWQLFTRIVLPLAAPGIAAVTMLSFLYAWNEYTYSIIFVQSPKNYTIPLTLATLNSEDSLTNFGLVAAGGIMSVLPVLAFVVFAQNYLIAGLSGGAVKE